MEPYTPLGRRIYEKSHSENQIRNGPIGFSGESVLGCRTDARNHRIGYNSFRAEGGDARNFRPKFLSSGGTRVSRASASVIRLNPPHSFLLLSDERRGQAFHGQSLPVPLRGQLQSGLLLHIAASFRSDGSALSARSRDDRSLVARRPLVRPIFGGPVGLRARPKRRAGRATELQSAARRSI